MNNQENSSAPSANNKTEIRNAWWWIHRQFSAILDKNEEQ